MKQSILFIVFLMTLIQSSSIAQTLLYKGLSVGINDYTTYSDRTNSVSNATDFRYQLYTNRGWYSEYVPLLTNASATKTAIMNAISAQPRLTGNTSVLFFSGNGDPDLGIVTSEEDWISPSELEEEFGTSYDQYAAFIEAPYSGMYAEFFDHGVMSTSCEMEESGSDGLYGQWINYGLSTGIETAEALHAYAAYYVPIYNSNQHPQIADNYSGTLSLKDDNVYVPDQYSTLAAALSAASSGERVVLSGSNTLSANVTVPAGVTLWLKAGSTLTLNGYSVTTSSGTITVQSGSTVSGLASTLKSGSTILGLHPTIQSGINGATSGSSQTVQISSGSFTENPSISSKNYITLAGNGEGSTTVNGSISVTNSSYVTVSNLSTNSAVTFNNGSHCTASSVTSTGTTLAYCYGGSSNGIGSSTVASIGASFGVNVYAGSGDVFYSTIQNGDLAIFLTNNASYNIGDLNDFCGNWLDIYTSNGGYAYAISNSYSCPVPNSISGNVYITGQNTSCAQECGGFRTLSTEDLSPTKAMLSMASAQPTLRDLTDSYLGLLRRIRADKTESKHDPLAFQSEFEGLSNAYRCFVSDTTDVLSAREALTRLFELSGLMENREGFYSFVSERLVSSGSNGLSLALKRYLIWKDVDAGKFADALAKADDILANAEADETLTAELLYEKGLIFKYYLVDDSRAQEMTSALAKKESSGTLARFAMAQFGIESNVPAAEPNSTDGNDGPLALEVIPNPFNPETQLTYSLVVDGVVQVQIVDMLGRVVSAFEEGQKAKGRYRVVWNASRFSSGVYIAKVTVVTAEGAQFMQTARLMLAK